MTPPALSPAVIRFEVFEVSLETAELCKSGRRVKLQEQPFRVLAMLLERRGEMVTREEMRQKLWPADTFVDFDHGLNSAVARLREALNDSAENPRFIETVPRRGYRFIAHADLPASPDPSPDVPKESFSKRRGMRLIVTLFFCGAIGLVAWVTWQHFYAKSAGPPIHSIAVLPLQNLSGDAAQEYFADGMTEELITELSRIHALKVISRTSVMEYKGTKKHLPQIARELGVEGIVEGSVIREGDQVRITVQLLDGPNDRHIWSEDYQRELARDSHLAAGNGPGHYTADRIQLTPQQQHRFSLARPVNPRAYEAYLRGRYYLTNQATMAQPLNMAQRYFEEAIQRSRLCVGLRGTGRLLCLLGAFQSFIARACLRTCGGSLAQSPGTGRQHR